MNRTKIKPEILYWAHCGECGEIELKIPGQAILDIARPGPADEAVAYWAPRIERPEGATEEAVRAGCWETGAWDDDDLLDDKVNWERTVWMAACDVAEEDEPEEAS